jgi:hypothetical protein
MTSKKQRNKHEASLPSALQLFATREAAFGAS